MRFSKVTPITRADEIDNRERMIRVWLPNGEAAMAVLDIYRWDMEIEEQTDLWSRFAANERSAMKARRDVRKGR